MTTTEAIETLLEENRKFSVSEAFKEKANVNSSKIYEEATENRLRFWEAQANGLHWFRRWETVLEWKRPYAQWFKEGRLNAAYNCLDIHLEKKSDKTAIIWEGENGEVRTLSYAELHHRVCQCANVLTQTFKVKKGDRVTIYMPMIPELAIAVLACARIGAIHSVVFGGFSSASLKDRLIDSASTCLITADGGRRRGTTIPLKSIVDTALSDGSTAVTHVLVVRHINEANYSLRDGEYDWTTLMNHASNVHQAEIMNSEDILFILYTSGTTGKPKGIIHTTGGYLTHAKYSTKVVFDLKDDDIYWCTADIGWITGHTYLIYGPLSNGATCVMFEGTPDYPNNHRFWELIAKHRVSIFYTAPTAIRAFMKVGETYPKHHDLSSLRLLGTVGEPINPEAWMWYYTHVGGGQCPIVDTWWQTETGGIMISNLPGANDMAPGKAGLPLPGIDAAILDNDGSIVTNGGGLLSLTKPWPSMLRGIWGDPKRFEETYWSTFETYFAGDGATIDDDGYVMVLGRVDDVLNCAGHRIGTMEVESALVDADGVCEAAVVGMPDEIKGQAIAAFIILENGCEASDILTQALTKHVANTIGAIAKPKLIVFTPELPKTRSGKIMRRILRAIAEGKDIGDTTTLGNPECIPFIKTEYETKGSLSRSK